MNNLIPKNKAMLDNCNELSEILEKLIGTEFLLSGKTRTDGAKLRNLVYETLMESKSYDLASADDFEILTEKGKGIPRILPEFLDTFIITNDKDYNMQVWNRVPDSDVPLIKYSNGDLLTCRDVRYLLVKIKDDKIVSILLLTPDYIVQHFGKFGVPTIKHQLIINNSKRNDIINSDIPILFENKERFNFNQINDIEISSIDSIHDKPVLDKIIKIDDIYEIIKNNIIGINLTESSTKKKGQELEKIVAEQLKYTILANELLAGGFPDIPSQLLEVKVQDSPTVDLGKYTPQIEEVIDADLPATTHDIRYLIALTNEQTNQIEGAVLCPGIFLGNYFSYVASQSYKCQRGIPNAFFQCFIGKSIFNPDYNE